MAWIGYALPVLPGQGERLERFQKELEPYRDRYLELNRRGTVKRHLEWLQRSPQGDLRIVVFEVEDPLALDREFEEDDTYDQWWRSHTREVHGFDPAEVEPSFPTLINLYEG